MSTQYKEFPELTPEARAAHDAAISAIRNGNATISCADLRRALAASLREAMEQATEHGCVLVASDLQAIADNLHSPPPPPPTLAQAREAARQLAGADAEIVHAFLASLGEGEQP
jgi:methionine synthase II (cobalamin-independent)